MLGPVSRLCRSTSCLVSTHTVSRHTYSSQAEVNDLYDMDEKERSAALARITNRLDRNRDGTKKLKFAIVGPEGAQTVNELLYATYHPYEPLTQHLNLCTGSSSLGDVDRKVEEILVKNLTLVAYDEAGKPVGTAVNNSCYKEEMEQELQEALDKVLDPAYRPIQAIRHQLRRQNRHIYDEIGTDKMFSIRMVGVEPESRGQGVATNLIRRSILLAGCLGFRGIKAEATGRFSRETFERVGMLPGSSIKYADFTYQGEKVFEGLSKDDKEITFMKKKFFQSALKHIL